MRQSLDNRNARAVQVCSSSDAKVTAALVVAVVGLAALLVLVVALVLRVLVHVETFLEEILRAEDGQ